MPGRTTGVVALRSTVFNQRHELVLEGLQKFLIRRRTAQPKGGDDPGQVGRRSEVPHRRRAPPLEGEVPPLVQATTIMAIPPTAPINAVTQQPPPQTIAPVEVPDETGLRPSSRMRMFLKLISGKSSLIMLFSSEV